MKVGRVRKNGISTTVVFTGDGPIPLRIILGLSENDVEKNFYRIIMEKEDEILGLIGDTADILEGDWEYDIPVPRVNQIRDFYAFEDHVKAGRASRGLEMIPEWYEIPVFYYSGTSALLPCGKDLCYPSYSNQLDFELEAAVLIGREGKNIKPEDARNHIAGLMLMNDWSARDEQKHEMTLNLGPAKSKDFGTSLGPYMVTGKELWAIETESAKFDVDVSAYVNGTKYSEANLKTMYWSFGDMIERASRDVFLREGDIIMSGTVGTGCILEVGAERYGWLKRGDEVLFESPVLGRMKNRII